MPGSHPLFEGQGQDDLKTPTLNAQDDDEDMDAVERELQAESREGSVPWGHPHLQRSDSQNVAARSFNNHSAHHQPISNFSTSTPQQRNRYSEPETVPDGSSDTNDFKVSPHLMFHLRVCVLIAHTERDGYERPHDEDKQIRSSS